MPTTGLHGGIEHVAALFFLVTLPAGALAALCGHLALRVGPGAAFAATGVAWVLLSFPGSRGSLCHEVSVDLYRWRRPFRAELL